MMEVIQNSEMPTNLGGHPEIPSETNDMQTPEKKNPNVVGDSDESPENSGSSGSLNSQGKPKSKYKGKGLDSKGRPRNFYNPPGKVLKHLAQQSYYDNFYGSQGHFYTLKQKFKTQMCKHFLDSGRCPLQQYCQFAHGPTELRQPNDPLPKNFGKTALGAVHSNYKTEPCKMFLNGEECKFGDGCSFYHTEAEKRKLIDPLPNLPEGVTLPPMPEKMKSFHHNKRNNYKNHDNQGGNMSPSQFNPNYQQNQMIQITSIADLAALSGGFGGFNPNKYMSPAPVNFGNGFNNMNMGNGFNTMPPHMMYQQQMQMSMYQQPSGQPMPFGTQTPNQAAQNDKSKHSKTGSPNSKSQRYEKKDKPNSAQKSAGKKSDKTEQKKYVTKQKKDTSGSPKQLSDKKPVENVASA